MKNNANNTVQRKNQYNGKIAFFYQRRESHMWKELDEKQRYEG